MKIFYYVGEYIKLLGKVFTRPERTRIFIERIMAEGNAIGVDSLGIVAIISVFIGAVTTINTAYQLVSGFVPNEIIGSVVSDSTILEFSPTICSLVLAGKIGSNIATELGSMRVAEEIDAMEVMGVNAASYLILPKIIAALITIPMLILISMCLSILGGFVIGQVAGLLSAQEFVTGARNSFRTYTLIFAMIKTYVFAFVISSMASYQGYNAGNSSIEVGKASTRAVVYSSVLILLSDYILAQLLL